MGGLSWPSACRNSDRASAPSLPPSSSLQRCRPLPRHRKRRDARQGSRFAFRTRNRAGRRRCDGARLTMPTSIRPRAVDHSPERNLRDRFPGGSADLCRINWPWGKQCRRDRTRVLCRICRARLCDDLWLVAADLPFSAWSVPEQPGSQLDGTPKGSRSTARSHIGESGVPPAC